MRTILPLRQNCLPLSAADLRFSTKSAIHITFGSSLHGKLTTRSYKVAGQNSSSSRTTAGTTTATAVAKGLALPAESMLVLTTS
jgi:hypothetical protein